MTSAPSTDDLLSEEERNALRAAYGDVRKEPTNPDKRLFLAHQLAAVGHLDYAARHAIKAFQLASDEWPKLLDLGDLLMKLGSFREAQQAIEQGLLLYPNDARSHRTLSALLDKAGDAKASKYHLIQSAKLAPITKRGRVLKNRPTVLRLRYVDNSVYGFSRNRMTGLRQLRFRRGHFSIKSFINRRDVNLYVADLTNGFLPDVDTVPPVDVVINCVSCADRSPDGLQQVRSFLDARLPGVPVINQPEPVMQTTRALGFQRLGSLEGVIFPKTVEIRHGGNDRATIEAIVNALPDYPMLLRLKGTQTGDTMAKIDRRDQLEGYIRRVPAGADLYAIEYIDCQDGQGFFHKSRAFFIDGQFYPVANLTSDTWQIHSGDRYRVMDKNGDTQILEQRYLSDPKSYLGDKAFDALHAIRDVINLDFFGIDFTLTPNGDVLVFEANPAMRHNYDHAGNFPYTRPFLNTISSAFNAMVLKRAKS